MTDDVFDKTMEVWKQRYSGFTPMEKKGFDDRVSKCSAAVCGILGGGNKELSPLEIQDEIKDDDNLGLILPLVLDKMEAEGIIEPTTVIQVLQPFPYSQSTYRLKA